MLTVTTLTTAIPTTATLTMAALTTAALTHLGRRGGRQLARGDQRVSLLAKDEARPARHAHPPRRHLVGQHAAVPRGCSQGGKQLARRAWLGFRVRVGVRVRVRVGAGARVRAGVRAAGRAAQQHRPPPRQDGAPRDLTQLRDRSCRHLRFQPPTFPGYHPMRGRAARGARPSRVAAACQ